MLDNSDQESAEIILLRGLTAWKDTIRKRFEYSNFSVSSGGDMITAYRKLSNGKILRIGCYFLTLHEGHIFDRRVIERDEEIKRTG